MYFKAYFARLIAFMFKTEFRLSSSDFTKLNKQLVEIGYQLEFDGELLQLSCIDSAYKPLSIDFISGKNRHRRLFGGGKNQPLARSVGIKDKYRPDVIDVTAGLGRDAFVLATLGCKVTMLERSPVIAALLGNALGRASQDSEVAMVVARMQLIQTDSLQYLSNLAVEDLPSVIYMDPMYPHRDKSALVKKEMRIFREIIGDDEDSDRLLQLARQRVKKRVVVKRPKGASYLAELKPHAQINSKNTRYDIYMPG